MFSQAAITSGPFFARSGNDLVVSWTSSAPAGTTFQVYLDRRLRWSGTALRAVFPWPALPVRADIGTVGPGEAGVDFSASLPAAPADRARLEWDGGTWEAADIAGYYVYMSLSPGVGVSYDRPVATVPFQTGPLTYGGYGEGGYGDGGYGGGDAHFSWTSGPLSPGLWTFTVAPFDAAGNIQQDHLSASVTIAGPPRPPAPDSQGRRLTYTLDGSNVPTLHWLASPSA